MPPDRKSSSQPMIWMALVVTLALVYWQSSQEENSAPSEELLTKPATTTRSAVAEATHPSEPPQYEPLVIDTQANPKSPTYFTRELPSKKVSHVLFTAHEWLPPPPKPQPPPPPQAPPLPYSYVGSLKDMPDGDLVILMQQKKMLMPKLGSQVDGQWRLDREDLQTVYFTYMPLNKKVVLSKSKTSISVTTRPVEPENNLTEEMLNQ